MGLEGAYTWREGRFKVILERSKPQTVGTTFYGGS